jgi:hypothetical protein
MRNTDVPAERAVSLEPPRDTRVDPTPRRSILIRLS